MIKAVLFDMDGVLADTEPFWQEAQCRAFGEIGINLSNEDCAQTMGMRIHEVVDFRMKNHPHLHFNKKMVVDTILSYVVENIRGNAKPMPGVAEILESLEGLELPLALVSSSHYRVIYALLESLQMRHYFDLILSSEDMPYGKPHPMPYLQAAEYLDVPPEECLVFEDSPKGVLSALSAGMRVIAIPNTRVKENPIFELAQLTLDNFHELKANKISDFFG
ncbi:MAG: hexitol phosphatase HxpB [Bacteroidota bacterium]|jgi:HAD superfamily hydrolase (TIGR01509 family)